MAIQVIEYFRPTGCGILRQEHRGRDQQAGSAVPALKGMMLAKGSLQPGEPDFQLFVAFERRQTADRLHHTPVRLHREHETRPNGHIVNGYRAGPTHPVSTSHVHTAGMSSFTQKVTQQVTRANPSGDGRTVDGHMNVEQSVHHAA
jgi:hypothetical protein